MKTINYILSLLAIGILFSCNSDEVICETHNPDTDQVICNTGLLVIRSELDAANQTMFSLDSLQKPVSLPLAYNNIQQNGQQSFFVQFTRPSNYDAYNTIHNTYFIEFPLQQRLFKYDIATQTRQEFSTEEFYAAPVFNNGNLYAVSIENFGYANNPAEYGIELINQNDGTLTNLITGTFPLQSSFNWESMSSVTDNNGTIYFVSGSNLITYNINTTTTTHIELVPSFDFTNNFQIFYGLELRSNGNLLAIRKRDTDQGEGLELVEININNPTESPSVVFNFMANGIELNSEFYSTTYDACDDKYYITSRSLDNSDTTNFHEINLQNLTFSTENVPFYILGIESKNN